MYPDKEFLILEQLKENESLTQRQLSNLMGISVGSVNMLLNKMIREGLIKVKNIPPKRVMYMLTPAGMLEKSRKTYQYIIRNYRYINVTKNKIYEFLNNELSKNDNIYLFLEDDELSQIVRLTVKEFFQPERCIEIGFEDIKDIDNNGLVIVSKEEDKNYFCNLSVKNVLDIL